MIQLADVVFVVLRSVYEYESLDHKDAVAVCNTLAEVLDKVLTFDPDSGI